MTVNRLINNIMVEDVQSACEFYTGLLGFKLMMAVPEGTEDVVNGFEEGVKYSFAALKNGEVELMFQSVKSLESEFPGIGYAEPGKSMILYMQVTDVDGLFERIRDRVEIVKGLHEAFYGMKEFYVKDINGYMLGFAEKV